MGFNEISDIAQTIGQAEWDPLPPDEWGEVYERFRRICVFELDDLTTLVEPVPAPDAQINLRMAKAEYLDDLQRAGWALGWQPSLSEAWRVFRNGWDWARFWAVRWPDSKGRARFAELVREYEAAADRLGEKPKTPLKWRGVEVA
jgi:hypothetical protein